MIRSLALAAVIAVIAGPALADTIRLNRDRLEDRLDRRESIIDARVDRGPLDVLEDRIDSVESRLDRHGIVVVRHPHWHERRTIRVRVLN